MAKIAKLNKPLVNRIVGHGEEQVDQLLANPLNFRLHPDQQQQALAGAMDDIGFIRSVTVNKRTGRVVDGHLRVTIAARSNVDTLPVEYVDLDEAEEAQALLSLDPIAALAATDKAKLDELMRAVQSDDERVQAMMSELAEREGLEYGKAEKQDDPGAQVDRAEELREKWGVELGQLWQLGDHRLICGDCTDRAVVDRVMGGEKAEFICVDPPYKFQPYGGGAADALITQRHKDMLAPLTDYDPSELFELIEGVGFGSIAVWCNKELLPIYLNYAIDNKHIFNIFVWVKDGVMPFSHNTWHSDVEYCVYMGTKSRYFENHLDNSEYSKFFHSDARIGRRESEDVHPTVKPIEFISRLVHVNSSKSGIVADFYLGSGTTLVACERLSRKCRAAEISPAYCAVTLQRWSDMTGQTPTLLDVS